jgi:hypothetical protein
MEKLDDKRSYPVELLTTMPVGPSIEEREQREARLREAWDDRLPIEKLFEHITSARLNYYRPDSPAAERQDIPCFCCGRLYRPDDATDGENVYLCGSCILTRRGG